GHTSVLHARQWTGTGAAVMTRDLDVVGVPLRHAGGDGTDAGGRHQLDADPRRRVDALEIVDELRQVLDRVDVVVGRRADERHAGYGPADLRDLDRHLEPGDLAALPRFGTLGHLDLDLASVDEVLGRHTEAPGSHLLDGAVGE